MIKRRVATELLWLWPCGREIVVAAGVAVLLLGRLRLFCVLTVPLGRAVVYTMRSRTRVG